MPFVVVRPLEPCRTLAGGKTRAEAMRSRKRRISDASYRQESNAVDLPRTSRAGMTRLSGAAKYVPTFGNANRDL